MLSRLVSLYRKAQYRNGSYLCFLSLFSDPADLDTEDEESKEDEFNEESANDEDETENNDTDNDDTAQRYWILTNLNRTWH